MKQYRVILSDRFLADLEEITLWLASQTSVAFALEFASAVEAYCAAFSTSPARSTPPDPRQPQYRHVTFRRSVQIGYEITGGDVVMLRAVYRGRDLKRLMADYPSKSSE